MVIVPLSEFRVDVGYLKTIVDFYDRKCPCWGGKYSCPCRPFLETKECRCGALRTMNDPKGRKPAFKTYKINFSVLSEIISSGYSCPEEEERTCFCKEFLDSGRCRLKVLEKISNSLWSCMFQILAFSLSLESGTTIFVLVWALPLIFLWRLEHLCWWIR